jgi:uncharacterized protein YjbI with pentapeptide repeats
VPAVSTQALLARRLLPWRDDRGHPFVGIIVKAGYGLADGRVAAPAPIEVRDLVPFRPLAEIAVHGRLRREPTPRLAGFAFARGVDVLLQKTLLIRAGEQADAAASLEGSLPHLEGGEQVRLLGFDAVGDDFTFRLPLLLPRAVLRLPDGRPAHVPFVCDGLIIDVDRNVVSVTYRGAIAWRQSGDAAALDPSTLEVALHPADDDGKALGAPPAWTRARQAARKPVSPVVDRFELHDRSGLAALARPWTFRPGEPRRVFFVKATFDVAANGRSMSLAAEQPPLEGDRFSEDGKLERASDMAPVKHDVDVIVNGTARGVEGDSTATVNVSLGAMNASFELLAGAPVRLGPIGPNDPARVELLGSFDEAWLEERWPFLPADCDPRAFQAALPALRTQAIRDGDRLRVTGLLDGGGVIDLPLPAMRPRAFAIASPDAPVAEAPLKLDTLLLDAGARRLELVWRGSLPRSPDDAAERGLIVRHTEDGPEGALLLDRAIAVLRSPQWAETITSAGAPPSPRPLEDAIRRWAELAKKLAARATAQTAEPRRAARADVLRDVAARKSFAGRDLTRVDLAGADLRNADLRGAILRGATLDDAQLEGADLSGAVLASASISRASFDRAKLARADLRAARAEGASFREAELDHAVFSRAELRAARLAGARGKSVMFVEADLSSADLGAAKLPKADFSKAKIEKASLVGADIGDAKLYETRAAGAKLDGAGLVDARFELADLREASFQEARATGSTWDGANLSRALFPRTDLTGAVFSAANLRGAKLPGARAERASFRAADLTGADLRGANLRGASFLDARLDDAQLGEANLHTAELMGATLKGARLEGALVSGTKLDRPKR